jgi:hypothetical protein
MKYQKQILLIITFFVTKTVLGQPISNKSKQPSNFGLFGGFGLAKFNLAKSDWSQPSIDYADSLNEITSSSNVSVNFGLTYRIEFNKNLSLRPAIAIIIGETGKLNYERKATTEVLNFKAVAEYLAIPFIYRFNSKKIKPYIDLGPTILYHLGQSDETETKVSLNKFDLLGQIGFGIEIPAKHFKLSPELSFAKGFIDAKKDNNNLYTNTIASLHRQYFTLSFYFSNN